MRRIYSVVQMFFIALALAAVGSVISNIESIAGLGSLMSMAGGVMTIISIYQLRHENRYFSKAVRTFWIYVGVTFAVLVLAVMAVVQAAEGDVVSTPMLVVLCLLVVGVLMLALLLQYRTYRGFEDLRELRQIDYPPRRILWCFYLAVFSTVLSIVSTTGVVLMVANGVVNGGEEVLLALADTLEMLGNLLLVAGTVIEAIHLWLMFTYMQAVRAAAEAEFPDRWDL